MYVAEGKFSCKAVEPDTRSRVLSKQGPALGLREEITVKQIWPHLDIFVSDGVMPDRRPQHSLRIVFGSASSQKQKLKRLEDRVSVGRRALPLFS